MYFYITYVLLLGLLAYSEVLLWSISEILLVEFVT